MAGKKGTFGNLKPKFFTKHIDLENHLIVYLLSYVRKRASKEEKSISRTKTVKGQLKSDIEKFDKYSCQLNLQKRWKEQDEATFR